MPFSVGRMPKISSLSNFPAKLLNFPINLYVHFSIGNIYVFLHKIQDVLNLNFEMIYFLSYPVDINAQLIKY